MFIDYLRSQKPASNVDLEEVPAVDLRDLKGVDDVLRSLEINIVLPLENDALANQFHHGWDCLRRGGKPAPVWQFTKPGRGRKVCSTRSLNEAHLQQLRRLDQGL